MSFYEKATELLLIVSMYRFKWFVYMVDYVIHYPIYASSLAFTYYIIKPISDRKSCKGMGKPLLCMFLRQQPLCFLYSHDFAECMSFFCRSARSATKRLQNFQGAVILSLAFPFNYLIYDSLGVSVCLVIDVVLTLIYDAPIRMLFPLVFTLSRFYA